MREPSKSRQPARTAPALSQVSAALLFFLIVLPGFSQPQESWQSPPRPNNQGDNQDTIKINVDLVVCTRPCRTATIIPFPDSAKKPFRFTRTESSKKSNRLATKIFRSQSAW